MRHRHARWGLCLLAILLPLDLAAQDRTYDGLSRQERLLVEDGLAWSGHFQGTVDGNIDAAAVRAARAYQRQRDARPTGVLSQSEIDALLDDARKAKDAVGYVAHDDKRTGIRIGLPFRLAPPDERSTDSSSSSRFAASNGSVEIELFRRPEAGDTLSTLRRSAAEQDGRAITYEQGGRNWFVVTGLDGEREFYTRARRRDDEVFGFTVEYDTSMASTVEPVIIAMSSAFARPGILDIVAPAPDMASLAPEGEPSTSQAVPGPSSGAAEQQAATSSGGMQTAMEPSTIKQDIVGAESESDAEAIASLGSDDRTRTDEDGRDEEEEVFAPGEPIAASVAVTPQGHYLTSASVTACKTPIIGDSYSATILGVDEEKDLALLQADTLEGALVGALADAPIQSGGAVILTTTDASLARGKILAMDDAAQTSIDLPADLDVPPGSPVLDEYGRVAGILGGSDGAERRESVSLETIRSFLQEQGVEPVIVEASDAPFNEGDLADTARLLTEMIFCDQPGNIAGDQ